MKKKRMSKLNFTFNAVDFSLITKNSNFNDKISNDIEYDKTTETYRVKRLLKIDPFTDLEIPKSLLFEFSDSWNPYTGIRSDKDLSGPLCFNALVLYDYFYSNRYKGLWHPPENGYQGYYGDYIGITKSIKIKSRGSYPERYLFRLPIVDCYLPTNHNYSSITIGPEFTNDEIYEIDAIILKHHPKRFLSKFLTLSMIKYYYDNALNPNPDKNCYEIMTFKKSYPDLDESEIIEKYNRYWVDMLVNSIY